MFLKINFIELSILLTHIIEGGVVIMSYIDNNPIDQVTKHMIEQLISRKKQLKKMQQLHLIILLITFIFTLVAIIYFYYQLSINYSETIIDFFFNIVTSPSNLSLFIILSCCFASLKFVSEQVQKLDDDFDNLRIEIIEKSPDLWRSDEAWQNRHEIFEKISEKFDINLYYEND